MTHTKVFKQEYKLRGCDNRESKIVWKQYVILRRHKKQKVRAAKQLAKIKWYGKPSV